MFHDIHNDNILNGELEEDRIIGAMLDEILNAADTRIHSRNSKPLEKLLTKIEKITCFQNSAYLR